MNISSGNAPWNLDSISRQTHAAKSRIAFLKKQESSVLITILNDLVSSQSIGISASLFLLGIDPRFMGLAPKQLFYLITGVLKERVK
jgi:hypothetical protein